MALTSNNSGKYLLKRWHRMRDEAIIDKTRFTQVELDWLEITAAEGNGEFNPEHFIIENMPIDTHAPNGPQQKRLIDIREVPEGRQ